MSFADVQTRSAVSVISRMANATATCDDGVAIMVIFDNAYVSVLSLVESTGPACTALSSDVVARELDHGSVLTVSGTPADVDDGDYEITGVQPDGSGLTVLQLRKADA